MKYYLYSVILLLCVLNFSALAQDQEVSIIGEIKELPSFGMFGDNYLITGTSLTDEVSPETSDAKFQIGFRQMITKADLPFDVLPFFTYRQKSFWSVYQESLPFRETNYNPSLGIAKILSKKGEITDAFWLALEHESNGLAEESSRSWNFFSLQYIKPYENNWVFRAKTWVPVGGKYENRDILKYKGNVELGSTYKIADHFYADADIRQAIRKNGKNSAQFGLSYSIAKQGNQFLYLQYYGGAAEDLINYNQTTNYLRVGVVFKDLMPNLTKTDSKYQNGNNK